MKEDGRRGDRGEVAERRVESRAIIFYCARCERALTHVVVSNIGLYARGYYIIAGCIGSHVHAAYI